MRKRRWAVIVFIIFLAVSFLSLRVFKIMRAEERLRQVMLHELRPILGSQFYIQRVHVGFANLYLMNVRLPFSERSTEIRVKTLRVGYSLLNLFTRGFDIRFLSNDALLIEPQILFSAVSADSLLNRPAQKIEAADSFSVEPSLHGQSFWFSKLPPTDGAFFKLFHYITIKNGRIAYAVDESTKIDLLNALEGGIFRFRSDSLSINLSGSFLGTKRQNIVLTGSGSADGLLFDELNVRLDSCSLDGDLPFLEKTGIRVEEGRLSGKGRLVYDPLQRRYVLSGEARLNDAVGSLLNGRLRFNRLDADAAFSDGLLSVRSAEIESGTTLLSAVGSINLGGNRELDVAIDADFSAADWAALLGKKIDGRGTANARLLGTFRQPRIDGNLRMAQLKLENLQLKDPAADFLFQDERLLLDPLRFEVMGQKAAFRGVVEKNAIAGLLQAEGRYTQLKGGAHAASAFTRIKAEVSGSPTEPILLGEFIASLLAPKDSTILKGRFVFKNKQLTLAGTSEADAPALEGQISFTAGGGPLFDLNLRHLEKPLRWYINNKTLETLLRGKAVNASLAGAPQRLTAAAELFGPADGNAPAKKSRVMAEIVRNGREATVTGELVLYPEEGPIDGHFRFAKNTDGSFLESFSLANQLEARLHKDERQGILQGLLSFNGLDLSMLFRNPSLPTGLLYGNVEVSGSSAAPVVAGCLTFDRLEAHGLGPYNAVVDFAADSKRILLQRLLLNKGLTTLLMANGEYRPSSDSLELVIKGAGFRAENAYRIVGSDTLLTGQALVDLQVNGRATAPHINGVIALKDGHLWKTPYDEMELRLGEPKTVRPAGLAVEAFRLVRRGFYELSATGNLPFADTDSLTLKLAGEGNFLAILSDADRFFKKPNSRCRLRAALRGTRRDPRLESVELLINDASMEFGSVVPPISEVKGVVSFSPDERFFRLATLEGKMGGKPFRIRSETASRVVCRRPLQNLTLADGRIDIGVLLFETSAEGVPLNISGLMPPQKFGLLTLNGREAGEKFMLAGTSEGPMLRGIIDLAEAEIMYPFYESGKKPSATVERFLEHLLWDLEVRPMKNTRFVRSFPGAIDEVYVNLKIDDRVGGLQFSGRLEDESFRINGNLRSTKGFIEYLDMNFRLEQAGVEFDRSSLIPVVYGQARATITDSLGLSSNILLTMQTVDNTMDNKSVGDFVRQEEGRARLDRIRFKLSSDNPALGFNEAKVLGDLGYSTNDLRRGAVEALGKGADNYLLRPLLRPVERRLSDALGLDYVRFSSPLTRNIIQFNLNNNLDLNRRLQLLESTKVIMGKYLSSRLFLQYTGQLESGVGYRYREKEIGLRHTLGLDYRINPQVLVELQYDYDSSMLYNRDDKRIVVRHWFPF